jgi:sigma-B regulation protein RsbU (phosphoserine phosphatase)
VSRAKAREDELDLQLPAAPRRDEIGVLTRALRSMGSSLRQHIRLQADSMAERARLEQELQIAGSIQQSMLPRASAASELPAAVQVAAVLLPARQVGGDLYDYFTLDNGGILFAIGDVSDKGIPAALFMARLSALLRVEGATGVPPDVLLSRINARLAEGNDTCMFVTMACVQLDAATGRMLYASAGHEPALLRNAEGDIRNLQLEGGPAIGIELTTDYLLHEVFLAPGDTLLLYTDGVTEAEAPDGSMFGSERLADLLRDIPEGDASAITSRVVETVAAQASNYHTTDDLTVLAVRWSPADVTFRVDPNGIHWRIECAINGQTVGRVQQLLHAILAARNITPDRVTDAELICEELLTNIIREPDQRRAPGGIIVHCGLTPHALTLTFQDDGPAFNPLAQAEPDLDADIGDRRIGGLGILLVKRLAGSCSYARTEDCNILQVSLPLETALH